MGGQGILFVLFENMSQRVGKKEEEEEEITTRMDGGSKERGNNGREPGPGACVEYEFAQVKFSCLFYRKMKKSNN